MRKVPKKPKAKGKRWPKGHSSSSNPETKKFREAAKSRFFQYESSKLKIKNFYLISGLIKFSCSFSILLINLSVSVKYLQLSNA